MRRPSASPAPRVSPASRTSTSPRPLRACMLSIAACLCLCLCLCLLAASLPSVHAMPSYELATPVASVETPVGDAAAAAYGSSDHDQAAANSYGNSYGKGSSYGNGNSYGYDHGYGYDYGSPVPAPTPVEPAYVPPTPCETPVDSTLAPKAADPTTVVTIFVAETKQVYETITCTDTVVAEETTTKTSTEITTCTVTDKVFVTQAVLKTLVTTATSIEKTTETCFETVVKTAVSTQVAHVTQVEKVYTTETAVETRIAVHTQTEFKTETETCFETVTKTDVTTQVAHVTQVAFVTSTKVKTAFETKIAVLTQTEFKTETKTVTNFATSVVTSVALSTSVVTAFKTSVEFVTSTTVKTKTKTETETKTKFVTAQVTTQSLPKHGGGGRKWGQIVQTVLHCGSPKRVICRRFRAGRSGSSWAGDDKSVVVHGDRSSWESGAFDFVCFEVGESEWEAWNKKSESTSPSKGTGSSYGGSSYGGKSYGGKSYGATSYGGSSTGIEGGFVIGEEKDINIKCRRVGNHIAKHKRTYGRGDDASEYAARGTTWWNAIDWSSRDDFDFVCYTDSPKSPAPSGPIGGSSYGSSSYGSSSYGSSSYGSHNTCAKEEVIEFCCKQATVTIGTATFESASVVSEVDVDAAYGMPTATPSYQEPGPKGSEMPAWTPPLPGSEAVPTDTPTGSYGGNSTAATGTGTGTGNDAQQIQAGTNVKSGARGAATQSRALVAALAAVVVAALALGDVSV